MYKKVVYLGVEFNQDYRINEDGEIISLKLKKDTLE